MATVAVRDPKLESSVEIAAAAAIVATKVEKMLSPTSPLPPSSSRFRKICVYSWEPKKIASMFAALRRDLCGRLEDLSITLPNSNMYAFTLAELKATTKTFTNSNFIGSGGFGPIYKGHVDDKLRPGLKPQFMAVKFLDPEGTQGHREWLEKWCFWGS